MAEHTTRRMVRGAAVLGLAALLSGCGTSSADDVCGDLDKVVQEIADDDVPTAFNGEIFDALDNLAKEVKDFDEEPDLQAQGEEMLDMANDDSASIDEVEAMIADVKEYCATR